VGESILPKLFTVSGYMVYFLSEENKPYIKGKTIFKFNKNMAYSLMWMYIGSPKGRSGSSLQKKSPATVFL
jgi:hypothetical protein